MPAFTTPEESIRALQKSLSQLRQEHNKLLKRVEEMELLRSAKND